jgi:hypothetical protein
MFCHGFRRWDGWGSWSDDEQAREPGAVGSHRSPDVRVSQAERDEVATVLGRHYADGRLSVGEYEERVSAALEARTGRDLDGLLSDLPALPAAEAPRPAFEWARLAPYLPRILAVTAVVALAIGSGLWVLWLLWPALALTSPRRRPPYRHYRPHPRDHRAGPRHGRRPATHWL